MQIKVKKKDNNKKFFEEIVSISLFYYKLIKKPNSKVANIKSKLIKYICLLILCMLISIYMIVSDNLKVMYIILLVYLILLFIFSIIYLVLVNKKVKKLMNDNIDSIITIDEVGIKLSRKNHKDVFNAWQDIKYIIINEYSITTIPTTMDNLIIGVSLEYKEAIVASLKEYHKEDLLFDNSKLY